MKCWELSWNILQTSVPLHFPTYILLIIWRAHKKESYNNKMLKTVLNEIEIFLMKKIIGISAYVQYPVC